MEDWIRQLILEGTSDIRGALDAIRKRITAVFGAVVTVMLRLRGRFAMWLTRARQWKAAALGYMASVLTTLRWLSTVYIPRKLGELARSLQAWTREQIAAAIALARREISALRAWALAQVRALAAELGQATRELWAELGAIRATVARLVGRVFGVLATPERLATWIVGAMAAALVRFAISQADAVAEWVWRQRVRVALRSADWIERIVSRII